MPVPRLRTHAGPAVLSYGFRPFFLLGSIFSAIAILLWLPLYLGELHIPTAFSPRDWHVHEMLYGFLPAVVTGFLLTAIPNWTGRLPLQGLPLLGLVLLWAAGRLAVATSALIGWRVAAVVDLLFLACVLLATGREIVAGRNWRNLRVLVPVSVLLLGNAVFHVEAGLTGVGDLGARIGSAAMLALVMLIAGRIVPSFTRNWLVRNAPGRLPAPFSRIDAMALALGVASLALWIARPDGPVTAVALVAAGLLHAVRLSRWAGDRTVADRLVLILHLAYAFVPLGFVLTGLAAAGLVVPSAGIHAWTAGAFGVMTLAVMSRASLGHTGRALTARPLLQLVYAIVIVAAASRIVADVVSSLHLIEVSAIAWIAGFALFVVGFWSVLAGPSSPGSHTAA
jgi:uncharacterized protein involved in response to NO